MPMMKVHNESGRGVDKGRPSDSIMQERSNIQCRETSESYGRIAVKVGVLTVMHTNAC